MQYVDVALKSRKKGGTWENFQVSKKRSLGFIEEIIMDGGKSIYFMEDFRP